MADIQPLFPAAYFDGLSAKEYPALFSAVPGTDTVRIFPAEDGRDGEPLCEDWPLGASAIISGSLAYAAKGDPVHLRREPDDGQRLVLRRPESIAAMQRLYRVPAKKKAGKTFNAWIWGTVAVWIFFIAVYLAGPTLFRVGAELVPQSVEESMGKSSQKMILQALSLMDGVEGVNYLASDSEELKKLMDRLVRAGDTQGYTFKVTVLNADFVNAFALPGGYIVVSTGLIKDCESPDELAGVLSHEMVHVTERHGTRRMLRYQLWSMLLQFVGSSDGGSAFSGVALNVVGSSFDRDEEREADRLGLARLEQAGISPKALGDFFARLEKEHGSAEGNGVLSYLASHPPLKERTATAKPSADDKEYTPALSPKDWAAFRKQCLVEGSGKNRAAKLQSGE